MKNISKIIDAVLKEAGYVSKKKKEKSEEEQQNLTEYDIYPERYEQEEIPSWSIGNEPDIRR